MTIILWQNSDLETWVGYCFRTAADFASASARRQSAREREGPNVRGGERGVFRAGPRTLVAPLDLGTPVRCIWFMFFVVDSPSLGELY